MRNALLILTYVRKEELMAEKLPKGITRRKNGTLMARFNYNYQTYTLYGHNVKQLEKDLADLRYEVEHGLKSKGDNLTLNQWFSVWLYDYKANIIRETTLARYEQFYKCYIKSELGMLKLENFKQIIIQRHVSKLASDGYATKTIADVYSILHSMFKLAIQNNILLRNPCDGVILPKTKTKERRTLTQQEQRELLETAKEYRYSEPLISIALSTGLRSGELLGLKWSDINFDKKEIYVRRTLVYVKNRSTAHYEFKFQDPKTKNGTRTIPMQTETFHFLKKQKTLVKEMMLYSGRWNPIEGFEDLVFVNTTGRPRQGIDFRNDLANIEKRINEKRKKHAEETGEEFVPIIHLHPHLLRHTFASRCFEAGLDIKTVQTFMGHFSTSITYDTYVHVTNDKSHSEMNKLEELYKNIG